MIRSEIESDQIAIVFGVRLDSEFDRIQGGFWLRSNWNQNPTTIRPEFDHDPIEILSDSDSGRIATTIDCDVAVVIGSNSEIQWWSDAQAPGPLGSGGGYRADVDRPSCDDNSVYF